MNIILFEQIQESVTIDSSDIRYDHIVNVLHLTVGDSFLAGIINGPGGEARITDLAGEILTFVWKKKQEYSPLYPLTLLIAQIRPICMKRILREAVSLGVKAIIIVGTDTGEKSYREAKLWSTGEYKKYVLDGAMQSASTGIPEITFFNRVDDIVRLQNHYNHRIVLDNIESTSKLSEFDYTEGEVICAIGPERGWSARERRLFADQGFESRLLGTRVLRTETACSAGLSILLSRMGIM